jgi:hypothetical protein
MVNQWVIDSLFSGLISQDLSLFVMGNAAKHWALLVDFPGNLVNQGNRSLNHLLKNTWSQYRNRVLKMVPVGELDIIKPQSNCQKCIGIVCRILSCTSAQVISTNAEYPLRLTL